MNWPEFSAACTAHLDMMMRGHGFKQTEDNEWRHESGRQANVKKEQISETVLDALASLAQSAVSDSLPRERCPETNGKGDMCIFAAGHGEAYHLSDSGDGWRDVEAGSDLGNTDATARHIAMVASYAAWKRWTTERKDQTSDVISVDDEHCLPSVVCLHGSNDEYRWIPNVISVVGHRFDAVRILDHKGKLSSIDWEKLKRVHTAARRALR